MFFNHEKVRRHLLRKGRVYTLRDHKIREGRHRLVHGSYFKNTCLGYGTVHLVRRLRKVEPRALSPYLKDSGMKTAREWIDAFLGFTKGKVPRSVYLHRVDMISAHS